MSLYTSVPAPRFDLDSLNQMQHFYRNLSNHLPGYSYRFATYTIRWNATSQSAELVTGDWVLCQGVGATWCVSRLDGSEHALFALRSHKGGTLLQRIMAHIATCEVAA